MITQRLTYSKEGNKVVKGFQILANAQFPNKEHVIFKTHREELINALANSLIRPDLSEKHAEMATHSISARVREHLINAGLVRVKG